MTAAYTLTTYTLEPFHFHTRTTSYFSVLSLPLCALPFFPLPCTVQTTAAASRRPPLPPDAAASRRRCLQTPLPPDAAADPPPLPPLQIRCSISAAAPDLPMPLLHQPFFPSASDAAAAVAPDLPLPPLLPQPFFPSASDTAAAAAPDLPLLPLPQPFFPSASDAAATAAPDLLLFFCFFFIFGFGFSVLGFSGFGFSGFGILLLLKNNFTCTTQPSKPLLGLKVYT
ncbi:verprolin-like [Vigna umbellata]|uniref:verprolin-like n=1 Tax=Vigna umbellata TaxID=87088 RepID=UPI001F5F5DD5|nr:verprolin-like [Vigna umbellata]